MPKLKRKIDTIWEKDATRMSSEFLTKLHADVAATVISQRFHLVPLVENPKHEITCVCLHFNNKAGTLGGQLMLGDSRRRIVGIEKAPGGVISMDGPEGINCLAAMDRYDTPHPFFMECHIKEVSELPAFLQKCEEKIDSFTEK